jgi:hypothetical protein
MIINAIHVTYNTRSVGSKIKVTDNEEHITVSHIQNVATIANFTKEIEI